MTHFHTVAPGKEEINVVRFKSKRASQQLLAMKATELASTLKDVIAAGNIDARCTTDSENVNVFSKREAMIITSEGNGLYLLRRQTSAGNNLLGGGVSHNQMSKENMMHVVTEWLGR